MLFAAQQMAGAALLLPAWPPRPSGRGAAPFASPEKRQVLAR